MSDQDATPRRGRGMKQESKKPDPAPQPEQKPEQKPEPQPAPEPERQLLEDLGRTVEPWVHAGVCEARGWRPGRTMTAEEYRAACDAWLQGGIDGQ